MTLTDFLNIDFWQQFVTTTLGIAIGIPVALWVERRIESGNKRDEQKNLIRALGGSLRKNLQLVQQIKKEFSTEGHWFTPLYPVDLTILDATSANKYEVLPDADQAEAIDHARYELIHLNGKLTLLRESAANLTGNKQIEEFYTAIKGSIRIHLQLVESSINAALEKLGAGEN